MRKKHVFRLWLAILLTMILLIQPASVQADGEPDIDVDPTDIDFNTTEVYSSSSPLTVIITNGGTADLNIDAITILGADAANFNIQSDNCSEQTLAPGNSDGLELVFRPDATGAFYAALSIPSDDPDESLLNIPLSGTATRSSYTDKPICTEEKDQEEPAIYWDRIVWKHGVGYDYEIHMYDLTTEEEIEIPAATQYAPSNPAIWGDRIVWQQLGGSPSSVNIYMYDLITEEITEICTAASYQENPAIWGDRIVWQDRRNGNYDIYMYDLSTQSETAICTEESNQYAPAIWGDYIVWTDNRNEYLAEGNTDIYLYDLGTGTEAQITTDLKYQGSPAIWEDRIVWTDRRNSNSDIYMLDLSTGQETAVCTEVHSQIGPAISDDYIVWSDKRGSDSDIYLYEISTGSEVPFCTAAEDQFTPAIWGHRVVWEDRRNIGSSDTDIYSSAWVRPAGADLSITMTDLTDPIEKGYYLTYILEVTNHGPGGASGVLVTDSLPAGMKIISATSSQGVCSQMGEDWVLGNIGSMPAGSTVTLSIVVQPDSAGVVTNEATVEANEADLIDYNNTATVSTRVSRNGIVRVAGRWGTCSTASSFGMPSYYPCRFGAWYPSLAAGPDGEVHLSYTREGSPCMEHYGPAGFDTIVLHHYDDIYYTSTSSAWFHKQQIYEGYGIVTTLMGTGWPWSRNEAMWSAMATDDAGNLHIAYVKHYYNGTSNDPTIDSSYHLMYRNNVGGAWNPSEMVAEYTEVEDGHWIQEGQFWDLSLAVDSSGGAHITYIPDWSGDLIHVTNQYGSWVSQTISQGYDAYNSVAMALDSDDHMHFAFYCANYDNLGGLFYLTNAPDGVWQTPEYVDENWGGCQLEGIFTDIALDDDGNPHISYVSSGRVSPCQENTYYATKQGGVWTCTQVDEGDFQSACNTIAVDSSGEAHIAYHHVPMNEIRYATSANGWQPETIDGNPFYWGEYFFWNDIAVDSQDRVHIVYSKDDFIYEATRGTPAGEDIDYDGVFNTEEQGPDGLDPAYDGNDDGPADWEQGNVVSLHTADGTYYVTVASPDDTLLSNLQTMINPSPDEAPAGADFPFGFFDFMVYGLEPGADDITVDIYLPPGSNVESYYKYGATSDNLTPHWYEFLYDGETGAVINGDTVTLHFVDGGRGDGDAAVNGVIWEPGGPSSGSANIPPTAPEVDVSPDSPSTGDNLLCTVTTPSTDDDSDDITYTYEWYIDYDPNPVQMTTTTDFTNTVSSILTSAEETWKCVVTPNDGTTDGPSDYDQVTITAGPNTPPTAPEVDVTPDLPVTDDDLVCTITTESDDDDGDDITYTYEWYKDDVLQPDETTETTGFTETAAGENWKCVVTPNDGTDDGQSAEDQVIVVVASITDTITDDGVIDAITEADTEVDVDGSADVTVAEYADNPGTGFSNDIGKYIDVYIENVAAVTEIQIRVYYTDSEISGLVESSLRLQWWDGTAWAECSDTGVSMDAINVNGHDYSGYIWADINDNTFPKLDDLCGTPFGASGPAAGGDDGGDTAPIIPGGGGGAGSRGITSFGDVMKPSGELAADVNAVSSDLQVHLLLGDGTTCNSCDGGTIYWISIQALPEDEPVPAPPAGSVPITPYYKMEPDGATFNPPATCTVKYGLWELPEGADENQFVVMWWDASSNQWTPLETQVDAENKTVSAMLNHFSLYTVMLVPRPAEFELSGFSITPAEVEIDEEVTISILVTNTGDLAGSYEVILKLNDSILEAKTVTLDGHESETVSFEITPDADGEYTVNVGDKSGTFTVTAPEAPPETPAEPKPTPETTPEPEIIPSEDTSPEPVPTAAIEPATITEPTEESGVAIRWWIPSVIVAVVVVAGIVFWLIIRKRKSSKVEIS